ncbi:hypothetical protein JOM56_009290 [Amanita muscaria]
MSMLPSSILSGAHNFSTHDSTFNNVQRDYNSQETHYHGDESTYNFTYGVTPNGSPEQQHRPADGNGQTVPIGSGPFGGHLSGNQINNTWNYYTSPPSKDIYLEILLALATSNEASASPIPSPPSTARTPAQQQREGSQTIASVLDNAVRERGQQLNWRESIVDIMKLLNLESSFSARQKLAEAVGYQGERNGSYAMNVHLLNYVKGVIKEAGGNLTVARETVSRKLI